MLLQCSRPGKGQEVTVLSVSELYKSFADRPVLTGVSFQIQPGEKAGLIGSNGSGKTTLLKAIAGELQLDRGEIYLSKQTVVGYLPQKPPVLEGQTLRHHLEQAQQPLRGLAQEINCLEREISGCPSGEASRLEKLLQRYGEIAGQFQQQGGYELESRLQSVAGGLGFSRLDLNRELGRFSGGEKTRAWLAALLLRDPDLLLLDEPTNYLDRQGLEWLEKYLSDWPKSLIVVTHDRFFLDRVAGKILFLDRGSVKSYPGNYSYFQDRREQEKLTQARAYINQQAVIQKEEKFIREAKIDERTKRQAASRQKRLQKMELIEQPEQRTAFHPGFNFQGRSGRQVIEFRGVGKGFGGRPLFENIDFQIHWGDRVALVGPNGAGKTTILKLITGEEKPGTGSIKAGPSVKVAYFSQEQEKLNPQNTLLDEIISATDLGISEARSYLARYLFTGEQVYKRISQLSGGEKCRLALARLELIENNCLLLDEPTSHLDLISLEELEQMLRDYPGTLVLVSHDRYFLNTLVNRVFELAEGRLTIYNGSFREYMERGGPGREQDTTGRKTARLPAPRANKKIPAEPSAHRRQARLLEQRQQEVEEAIQAVEQEIASLELELADPHIYSDYAKVKQLHEKLRAEQAGAGELLKQWERISMELEALSAPADGHQ